MFLMSEGGASIPVIDPVGADGVFSLLWLVIALPLAGAAILLLGGRRTDAWGHWLGTLTAVGSFVLSVVLFVSMLGRDEGERQVVQHLYDWMRVGDLTVSIDLLLDPLSVLFLLLITGVGSLIHVYSIGYMEHDPRRRRFFAYLNLFVAAMLMLVLSENYLGLFLGWEGVGLASYLLIGFWQHKPSAAAAAKKAFVVNRVGDIGLSLGIALFFVTFGSTSFTVISANASGAGDGVLTALGLLLLLAACGKSAQVPLQSWLLDAMEGPTPVSALIHAATMVTAGVYLVVRSNFVFELAPHAQTAVIVVATVTLLWGAVIGCAKDDIKKALAGSTMSQIGYMMLAAGLGVYGYAFAIFHLITHGFFKANMFLGAGSVMHGMNDDVDMRRYGALRKADAGHLPDLRHGLPGDHRLPAVLGLLVQGQDHRDRAHREPGRRRRRADRRRRHRLLHDPADADDLLRREALEGRHAPPRVALGDDRPAGRARRAVGARRGALPRPLDRRLARSGRGHHPRARAAGPGDRDHRCDPRRGRPRRRHRVGPGRQAAVPVHAPQDVSFATRAARADLYGDTINETLVINPGRRATAGLTRGDRSLVDALFTGGAGVTAALGGQLRKVQNGFVRSYALSVARRSHPRRRGAPGGEPLMSDVPWLSLLDPASPRRARWRCPSCAARPR